MIPQLQSLKAVREIADEAVREYCAEFTVAAVLPGKAPSAYAEVLIVRRQSAAEPNCLLISVDREASPFAIRAAVVNTLAH